MFSVDNIYTWLLYDAIQQSVSYPCWSQSSVANTRCTSHLPLSTTIKSRILK